MCITLKYKTDIVRNYYPDFYLIDNKEYIEIKGYFSDKDRNKMKLIKNQNINSKINVLFKDDLRKLNILV